MRKTVCVTGASRGIGKAIAVEFAEHGYQVVINCVKRKEALLEAKAQIEALGVPCLAIVGDVGDPAFVKEMFAQVCETFGSVDVLVNNAGISYVGLLTDMTEEEWERIVRTNLSSVFHCSQAVISDMVQRKEGKIINISSVWGNVGASCEVAYSATKGGVNAFTRALAKELAPSNIQVNAVACGFIDTEMNRHLSDEELIDLMEALPAGRAGRAKEVGAFVYALAEGHDYLTGQVISFDGGWI